MTLENESWYTTLIEDCKDIVVETEFTSRWSLVEGRHQLGSRILSEYENFQRLRMPDSELVQRIALNISRQKRTVYYAIQFARMFPDLNLLPEGKNLSWSHVINKYLSPKEDKPERLTIPALLQMIRDIKQLLQTEWFKSNKWGNNGDYIRYLQDQVDKITGELQ